jgi:predicted membrane protein
MNKLFSYLLLVWFLLAALAETAKGMGVILLFALLFLVIGSKGAAGVMLVIAVLAILARATFPKLG